MTTCWTSGDKYLNAVLRPDRVRFCVPASSGSSGLSTFRFGAPAYLGFDGSFVLDSFAVVAKTIIVLATAIVVLLSVKYLEIEEANLGEYYALLLFAAVGMMFMVSGTDLVVLFIALEVMALCEYVLTGFLRGSRRSNEAAVKFFLLGAFSSGLLLYGMSLLYAIGGSTKLSDHCRTPAGPAGHRSAILGGAYYFTRGNVLQDCRRAFPSVDSGCLRRRADLDYRLHLRGAEGGFLRVSSSGFCSWDCGPCGWSGRL